MALRQELRLKGDSLPNLHDAQIPPWKTLPIPSHCVITVTASVNGLLFLVPLCSLLPLSALPVSSEGIWRFQRFRIVKG
ncbi:hypothetical protein M422DRAFT_34268 [Sphaerobolus stellatus SS14]|uniref:Uncharacterized protein n=1 Tax=Sphaerobolus stellatus (strain SS14) TaxID=990650 RepID=A0A0C9VFB0_SPHS4|nr:hypothetical protein M422DRAFT_34268 [Sphaerobolus stellatus SS14]